MTIRQIQFDDHAHKVRENLILVDVSTCSDQCDHHAYIGIKIYKGSSNEIEHDYVTICTLKDDPHGRRREINFDRILVDRIQIGGADTNIMLQEAAMIFYLAKTLINRLFV